MKEREIKMDEQRILSEVKRIVVDVLNLKFEPSELQENDFVFAYGINSVDALEILINIENEFDIQVEEKDLDTRLLNSLYDLSKYIKEHMDNDHE